jgi:hypothetical protein
MLPRKASKEHDLASWRKTFGEIAQCMKILLGENMVK